MGQDYSYSQPSSSDQYHHHDYSEDKEEEALILMDEGDSHLINARAILMDEVESQLEQTQATHFPPQPEVEFGFPKQCYCGGRPTLNTCYNPNNIGRRFFTCPNVEDGDMHLHKWWEDAAMEEMRELDRMYEVLSEKVDALNCVSDFETDQKLHHLELLVSDLGKKNLRFRSGVQMVLGVMAVAAFVLAMLVVYK
ncbi:uncharacterized protein At1g43920, Chloroplastic-like isoform X2 [Capsella rubella]|nr:uncharacterized protein At1g43920, Chloroplastic-like isoform X2 [Capsella rubella]XP_023636872.1 uncharacterized protein At1g43920, Chloroplastic-like isoform X2 [Capsella rubella]XP_023636877.1 uncharacterized protein At1g43920, Chloroplastic-like isoform X2 [Capsella rubella]